MSSVLVETATRHKTMQNNRIKLNIIHLEDEQ